MFHTIDYKNGDVVFIDDVDYFKEDLLQVKYPFNYLLDVGWYGESGWFYEKLQGVFKVLIIKDSNWEKPIKTYCCTDVKELKENIEQAILEIEQL